MILFRRVYYLLDVVKRLLIDMGMLRSIMTGSSVDRYGNPVPWISSSSQHFLESLDLHDANVFEFGSGNSTMYWAHQYSRRKIRSYMGIENCVPFYTQMARKYDFYRRNITCLEDAEDYFRHARTIAEAGILFDVTIVDGPIHLRAQELEVALAITDSEGFIIVDDSNWIENDLVRFCDKHFMFRIDFAGFSPSVSFVKVTSVLFRNPARFMGATISTPVGGMYSFNNE